MRWLTGTAMLMLVAACAQMPAPPPAPAPEPAPAAPPPPAEPPREAPTVPEPPAPVAPDESRQVMELVGHYTRVAVAGAEEQRREYNAASQAFNRERSITSRVRLALALSLPGAPAQDDARALGLLEAVAGGGSPLRQFAAFLHAQLHERRRAAKRAEQLKEQLDQLRAIERTIIERGRKPQPRRP